jgi:hypothetical protein
MAGKPAKGRTNGSVPKPIAPPKPPPLEAAPSRRGRPVDNWETHNLKTSDQNRVIAIRNKEGRYSHSDCSDTNKSSSPSKTDSNDLVLALMASRISYSGGMLCVLCDTYIVPPANRRDILRAEVAWERAANAFKEGKINKEDLAAAKRRFLSATNKLKETK